MELKMETQTENKIKFKLFVGCLITSDMRLHLNQSPLWKRAKIIHDQNDLVETHFHDKDYIGLFLPENKINLSELKEIEKQILAIFKEYLPQFSSEKIKILVFSQIFIS
jgi:hypothetical protein